MEVSLLVHMLCVDAESERNTVVPPSRADCVSYEKMCKIQGIAPCSRFQRQIDDSVADVSNSLLGTKDIKSICVALTVSR